MPDRIETLTTAIESHAVTYCGNTNSEKTSGNFRTYRNHTLRLIKARPELDPEFPEAMHAAFATEVEKPTKEKLGNRHRSEANATKRSASARNQMLWYLRELIPWMVIEGLVTEKAQLRLQRIKKAKDRRRDLPMAPVDQVEELIAKLHENDPRISLFVRFLALTGMRIGGALSVTWDSIDWERRTLRRIDTKGNNTAIPLLSEAIELLQRVRDTNPFRKREGTKRVWPLGGTLKKKVNSMLKQGPVGCTHAHALRHWFTNAARRNGIDIVAIATCLAHKDGGKTLMEFYAYEQAELVAKNYKEVRFFGPTKEKAA